MVFLQRKDRDEDDQVDVLCFLERKTETRMIRWMCGVSLKDRDEDDQVDVWCFPERQRRG